MFRSALLHGAAAGAAGTTALNAVTYLDMALRARPASPIPKQAVEAMASRIGQPLPGTGDDHDNRVEGLCALSGIATGVGIGAATGLIAPALVRLPLKASSVLVAVATMAATDVPMTRLGLTDPRSWSPADWASDVVPHLAYGLVTVATLRSLRRRRS